MPRPNDAKPQNRVLAENPVFHVPPATMSDAERRETYERMARRYTDGDVPWDHELPPPEVIVLLDRLPAGRALDVGCGYGTCCHLHAARLAG